MANPLLELLGLAGAVLDTPGALVRAGISPEVTLGEVLNPFSPEARAKRVYGRDLLREAGLAGEEDNWGNFAAGLATDIALDPLNLLLGGVGAARQAGRATKAATRAGAVKKASQATKANRAVDRLLARGAMPEEVAAKTLMRSEGGPVPFFRQATTPDTLRLAPQGRAGANQWTQHFVDAQSPYRTTADTLEMAMTSDPALRYGSSYLNMPGPQIAGPELVREMSDRVARAAVHGDLAGMKPILPSASALADPGVSFAPSLRGMGAPQARAKLGARLPVPHKVQMDDLYNEAENILGAGGARGILEELGFDALQTSGDVIRPFSAAQVYEPMVAPALRRVPPVPPPLAAAMPRGPLAGVAAENALRELERQRRQAQLEQLLGV